VTKLTSALSISETTNQKLQHQLQMEIKTREEALEAKDQEIDAMRDRLRAKTNEMQLEVDMKDSELAAALEAVQAKDIHIMKMEQTLKSDLSRLEKKLANQVGLFSFFTFHYYIISILIMPIAKTKRRAEKREHERRNLYALVAI
jgi:predicted phage tail protein